MLRGRVWLAGVAVVLLLTGALAPGARGQTAARSRLEAAAWQAWTRQQAAPAAHAEHADAWRALAADSPAGDALVPVAHTLAAWHELRNGRVAEAEALLVPYANADSALGTLRGARDVARAWLTCLDREQLVAALEAYRVAEVRYPEQLDALRNRPLPARAGRVVFQDRWGSPWEYRLERLRSMPALTGQRYTLSSRALGDVSELKTALALAYAARIVWTPTQVRPVPDRPPMVTFEHDAGLERAVSVPSGAAHAGLRVAYVSPALVIVSDRLHWKFFRTPAP